LPAKKDIRRFRSQAEFRKWLTANHLDSEGIWICFAKKGTKKKSINHAEALDQALCFGWIDGQALKHDETSWLQKFTRRRPKSLWSKINAGHVERLIGLGRMTPAGHAEIEAAKKDGRWSAAYDSPSKATIPKDFLKALARDKKAQAFFRTLNKTNLYSIAWRLQTAKKPATRQRRMEMILEMLSRGEKFH
jgi:uncharacterized protein YdeI (YjbR/CyaY-like superfamily)